ncbi:hypothetical protein MNBD_GAMMA12-1645 [hydrothermal vent metagenome]|uniref:SGNH hydrolase-type esterase domain-containing protein n=1 Tax=hydrothermal vent metagenome TaxID=652676 RepID=A0A3B0Z4Y6_9ZZZZ
MSLSDRYKIASQMSDYDKLNDEWIPYIMKFHCPNSYLGSVSTNNLGFRNSVDCDGRVLSDKCLYDDSCQTKGKLGVVVGSSVVFGVGSTSDEFTIPSQLNRITSTNWHNFGGRAFNSTQEILLFLLNLPHKLDKIVIVSGVNNLTLSYMNDSVSTIYSPFYSQSVFSDFGGTPLGVRLSFKHFINEMRYRIFGSRISRNSNQYSIVERYKAVISCFKRDLRVIKVIAKGLGVSVYFALQPLVTWIKKDLSTEEQKLFDVLDSASGMWETLSGYINSMKLEYFRDIQKLCSGVDIQFINLNEYSEFTSNEWLFVDRVHLTDAGNKIVANILRREFNL